MCVCRGNMISLTLSGSSRLTCRNVTTRINKKGFELIHIVAKLVKR
jgi:hypothetical protein